MADIQLKDAAQLAVSLITPFVAAGGALWIAAFSRRDRVSIVVTWGYNQRSDEISLVVIHNRSAHPIAITSIRYLDGVIFRTAVAGTALDYEDPTDLNFPYLVEAGALRKLPLDEHQAGKIAERAGPCRIAIARIFRRSRFLIECRTTAGTRHRTSGESVLPWKDQLPWRRGK